MALKTFVNDSNPLPGDGIRKWSSQHDLKFYKSKNPEMEKSPEMSRTTPQPIVATEMGNSEKPWFEKACKTDWVKASENTTGILKSISDTFLVPELEFAQFRTNILAKLSKSLDIPEKYKAVTITDIQKSKNVNDLKYRLAVVARTFGFASHNGGVI